MSTDRPALIRAIGRWSLAALVINSIIGSAVFGLPATVAAAVGTASPWVVVLAGLVMTVITGCYAEVASQFPATGGNYLYARETFGRFVGVQVGWFNLLGRLTACAAAVNLLTTYLGQFWSPATDAVPRLLIVTVFLAILTAINYRGVRSGASMSTVSTVAKLVPLALVCAAGAGYLIVHPHSIAGAQGASAQGWLQALLLLCFAYGGFESALNPMGEAEDPRRDVAFALFVGLGVVALIYTIVQFTVVAVLPDAAHSQRPLAEAAARLMGEPGAILIAVGALISVYGFITANLLTAPRTLFALAEFGDFPRWFAAVHPRYRTPHVAIVTFAVCIWLFAMWGSFSWNVTLSAVARLFYYGAVCAAVPVLRRKQPEAASVRVPAWFPAAGVLICVVLLTQVDFSKTLIVVGTIGIGVLNWLAIRGREPR